MYEILGLIGFTIVITNGYITEKLRYWVLEKNNFFGTLFSCSMCIGFWVGLLYSIFLREQPIKESLLFGFSISLMAHFTDTILNFLGVADELLWWKKKETSN